MKKITSSFVSLVLALGMSGTMNETSSASTPAVAEKRIIAAGGGYACAISEIGLVRCWGSGQALNVPANLGAVSEIFGGAANVCGVAFDAIVRCWGTFAGINAVPFDLGPVKQVSIGGDFACAIKKVDSSLKCWGNAPALPESFLYTKTTFTHIAVGGNYACAIYNQGKLTCWGNNDYKQLSVPIFKGKVLKVSAGSYRTCAIGEKFDVKCWGNESPLNTQPPVSLGEVKDISLGLDDHACAIRSDRFLQCWGGDPHSAATVQPPGLGKVYQIANGSSFTCTLNWQGQLSCWGGVTEYDGERALGKVNQWSLGKVGCAVTSKRELKCWGRYTDIIPEGFPKTNVDSVLVSQADPIMICVQSAAESKCIQQRRGRSVTWAIPKDVKLHGSQFSSVNSVNREGYVCYQDKSPTLICSTGTNQGETPFEQFLGNGFQVGYEKACHFSTAIDSTREIFCSRINNLYAGSGLFSIGFGKQVSIGFDNMCFIDVSDKANCIQKNFPDENLIIQSVPAGIGKVKKIVAGNRVNCVIDSSSLLKCWGSNENRLLDIPIEVKKVRDVQISESGTGICAQLEDSTLKCWGTVNRFLQPPLLGQVISKAKGISSVTLTGTPKVGQKLKAVVKSLDSGSSLTYVWKKGSEVIKGAVTSSYSLLKADKGKSISVEVTSFKPGLTIATKSSKSVTVR
jgi:hypothetical protein